MMATATVVVMAKSLYLAMVTEIAMEMVMATVTVFPPALARVWA